jgi:ubiquinone/menaquinone biosynthesis C-methylase UbiE
MLNIDRLYRARFSDTDMSAKERIWQVLCTDFFQRYIKKTDTLLEIACGYGEFIRHINAGKKIAIDINPDSIKFITPDVEFHLGNATDLGFISDSSVDVCFVSNFFEHLPSKDVLDDFLYDVYRVLRPGGVLMAMQPNIKYAAGDYWDFYDHHIPLSHLSCAEAFRKCGFEVTDLIGRFMPYSMCSALPNHPFLVKLYLAFPPVWRILGRQFFIAGKKPV